MHPYFAQVSIVVERGGISEMVPLGAANASEQGFPTLFWPDTPPSILVDR